MAVNSANSGYSNLRVGGLATGIDTDSMVENLMKAQRMPAQKLEQDRQILKWKQEDYREINASLLSFRNTVLNMKLEAPYSAKSISSSNTSKLTVTASGSALVGTHTVKIDSLASGARITGSTIGSAETKSTLKDQLGISGLQSITINGEAFNIDTDNASIYDLIRDINSHTVESGNWTVRASYDETLDRFFLASSTTGESQYIDLDAGTLADALKITAGSDVDTRVNANGTTIVDGQNADVTVDGLRITSYASNSFNLNGVTYNLLENSGGSDLFVTVKEDIDSVVKSITDFINSYNSLAKTLSDKTKETRYSEYLPLTDEQRNTLTQDQIDLWEKKARSGLLRKDTTLTSVVTRMRSTMTAQVTGVSGGYTYNGSTVKTDTLAKIGIKTTADYTSGELSIDQDALRKAVERDPVGVMDLFARNSENDDADYEYDSDYYENGIAERLYVDVYNGMKVITDKAGSSSSLVDESSIGKSLSKIDKDINRYEVRLEQIENRYWRQFTAMEKAINMLNSQSSWLSQMFSSGQK